MKLEPPPCPGNFDVIESGNDRTQKWNDNYVRNTYLVRIMTLQSARLSSRILTELNVFWKEGPPGPGPY
jgi:hypothetical protein